MSGHPDLRSIDGLDGAARREALEHAGGCAACRRAILADDPTQLFALLSTRPLPQDLLDDVSAGVAAAMRGEASLPRRAPTARVRTASAWAAAAVLAAALLVPLAGRIASRAPEAEAVLATAPPPRAGVQVIESPSAIQAVDLTVGETQLVMIFDPRLEL